MLLCRLKVTRISLAGESDALSFFPGSAADRVCKVLAACMVTAYLTVFLIMAYYLMEFLPSQDLNHIDRRVLSFLGSLRARSILRGFPRGLYTKRPYPHHSRYRDVLEKAILAFSDQQIITGLALLLAGFTQLKCGGINAYHWQTMIFTVWFSSLTHLGTLGTLRDYFKESNKKARLGRVVLMTVTLGLLLAALMPTANFAFQASPGASAECFYHASDYGFDKKTLSLSAEYLGARDKLPDVVMSATILVLSYVTHMLRLFGPSPKRIGFLIGFSPKTQFCRTMRYLDAQPTQAVWWHILSGLLLTSLAITRALRLVFGSFFWQVGRRLTPLAPAQPWKLSYV